jgi:hypothetical protein
MRKKAMLDRVNKKVIVAKNIRHTDAKHKKQTFFVVVAHWNCSFIFELVRKSFFKPDWQI